MPEPAMSSRWTSEDTAETLQDPRFPADLPLSDRKCHGRHESSILSEIYSAYGYVAPRHIVS